LLVWQATVATPCSAAVPRRRLRERDRPLLCAPITRTEFVTREVHAVAASASAHTLATTPTAAALADSIDKQAGRKLVRYIRVYVGGQWQSYYPGRSRNFNLYADEGVVVKLTASWGNDKMMHIPDAEGFWIDDTGVATWVPSPVGYT
jgi:hypothetical protein